MRKVIAASLLLAARHAGAATEVAEVSEAERAELEHEVMELRSQLAEFQELLAHRRLNTPAYVTREDFETSIYALGNQSAAAADAATGAASDQAAGDTSLGAALDSAWLLLCGTLVMFMHAGFAMLEAGCCRAKNVSNVLMKNLVNVTVGSLAWYFFGWGLAYGGPLNDEGKLDNGFIGTTQFAAGGFLSNDDAGNVLPYEEPGQSLMLGWYFQWAFCTAAATIVSGGVAERVKSHTYGCYAFVMAAFIYPVVVAWTWGYGWISSVADVGYMDFAGSGIVHLTGGVSALAGTIVLGPREGRFERPDEFAPHSLPLLVLGTLSLWFGWYGFNCGSTLSMHDAATGAMGAQVAMNTTMAAATGGITVFLVRYFITKLYDVGGLCNGILAGLVSITAGCGNLESGTAMFVGAIGGLIYQGSSMLQVKLKIDDPVDASSVHGACGIWGVLAVGLFDWGKGFDHYHGWSGFSCMTDADGNCLTGVGGKAIGAQIVLILAVIAWAGTLSGITFFLLMKTGMLRVDKETEDVGMDAAHHSPRKAYSLRVEDNQAGSAAAVVIAPKEAPPAVAAAPPAPEPQAEPVAEVSASDNLDQGPDLIIGADCQASV